MYEKSRSPVVVLGMHRSGTSILSSILEDLGLFLGSRKDKANESILFQNINKWLLQSSGARWDNPSPFEYVLHDENRKKLYIDYIKYILKSGRIVRYTGLSNYIQHIKFGTWDKPWGWKDPRNTVTLPLWKEIFEDARVLHIRRHGIDVAWSLKKRSERRLKEGRRSYRNKRSILHPIYWMRMKEGSFGGSVRVSSLDSAFSLWSEYLRLANKNTNGLDKVLNIKYENLLLNPKNVIDKLKRFCNIKRENVDYKSIIEKIDSSRAYRYRGKNRLLEIAKSKSEVLNMYNYEY